MTSCVYNYESGIGKSQVLWLRYLRALFIDTYTSALPAWREKALSKIVENGRIIMRVLPWFPLPEPAFLPTFRFI